MPKGKEKKLEKKTKRLANPGQQQLLHQLPLYCTFLRKHSHTHFLSFKNAPSPLFRDMPDQVASQLNVPLLLLLGNAMVNLIPQGHAAWELSLISRQKGSPQIFSITTTQRQMCCIFQLLITQAANQVAVQSWLHQTISCPVPVAQHKPKDFFCICVITRI
jgi:hypothetical protein